MEKKKRETRHRALGTSVLAVARQGGAGFDWSAYIDAVPGQNHDAEAPAVIKDGDKLPFEIAKALFPDFAEKYAWRY